MTRVSGLFNNRFQARLQKSQVKGAWTHVVMPDKPLAAAAFRLLLLPTSEVATR